MKKNKFLYLIFFLALIGCQEEEPRLSAIVAPSNLVITTNVADDQSGNVTVTPSAENALNYHVTFNPGASPVVIDAGETASFRYTRSGQYTAPITVVAFGTGGLSSSAIVEVELDVRLRITPEILAQIAGGDGTTASSKRWIWDQNVGGHFGVGPLTNDFPEFFSAGPGSLNPCLYDDVLTFSHDGQDNYSYSLDPGTDNLTFVNWTEVNRFFPDASPQQFNDECRDITDQAVFDSRFVIIDGEDGTQTMDVGESFLSYWAVIPGQYEILELSENRIALRGLSQPFNGDGSLAWYSVFVPEDQSNTGGGGQSLETQFTNLTWSDEFDVDGAPDPANWNYELGGGGFGNGESQVYTSDTENVIVENGTLSINAIATSNGDRNAYYVDDINQTNADGSIVNLLEDFEGTAPVFNNFGGSITQVIANPDPSGINTSATVTEFEKPTGAQTYAGSSFDLPSALDLSTNTTFRIKTYSPKVGAIVKFKIENSADTSQSYEVDANTTVENVWEELVYDLSAAPDFTYDRIVIFFDFDEIGNSGITYTSTRMKTEGLQEFTYGRAEIRAKLPTGGGTWPAIWMLGANFPTVGWPAAGEIDIMEHVGNQQDIIHGTTHDPNNFAGNGRTGSVLIPGVSDDFHIYEMEWTATEIQFAVDGQVYHTVSNDGTLPYNDDFYFIMNVAMGGSFGGDIDSAFVESTMEVDYIRFYQ